VAANGTGDHLLGKEALTQNESVAMRESSRYTLPSGGGRQARAFRGQVRDGSWTKPTSGQCAGFVQANLVILPQTLADDFAEFCARNPRAMPVLDVTAPGDPHPARTAPSADLRTDLPKYRIYRFGQLEAEVTDIASYWREDSVAFVLGCSFTAESKLLDAGVGLRHIALGQNVPMYPTNRPCTPSRLFHGPLVVSMRPIARSHLRTACEITERYPLAHGGPIHVGDPSALGIIDLHRPEWGDAIDVAPDEVPVFWACGVTPQAAIRICKPELAITHAPGYMFVTDVTDADIAGRMSL
jgi:uncharacterized protein YcsI (UPF0317 family)